MALIIIISVLSAAVLSKLVDWGLEKYHPEQIRLRHVIVFFAFLIGASLPQLISIGRSPSAETPSATLAQTSLTTPHTESNQGQFPTSTASIATIDLPSPNAPDSFIYDYYDAINDRNYSWAWNHLSDDFIARNHTSAQGGYSGFTEWWETVAQVQILSADTTLWDPSSAKVHAEIHYEMNSGYQYEDEVFFHLLLDSNGEWLIDATPTNW